MPSAGGPGVGPGVVDQGSLWPYGEGQRLDFDGGSEVGPWGGGWVRGLP